MDIFGDRSRIISTYLPDGSYDDATVEITYNKFDQLYDGAKAKQRQVILGGDLNVMIGRRQPDDADCIGPHDVGRRNARGAWLTSWASMHNLIFTSSFFEIPMEKNSSY